MLNKQNILYECWLFKNFQKLQSSIILPLYRTALFLFFSNVDFLIISDNVVIHIIGNFKHSLFYR